MWRKHAKEGTKVDVFINITAGWVGKYLEHGVSEPEAINSVREGIRARITKLDKKKAKKSKKKITRRVDKYEIRNNPMIVQQAVLGVWVAAGQPGGIEKALDTLSKSIIRAVKDGDLSKKDARKIFWLHEKYAAIFIFIYISCFNSEHDKLVEKIAKIILQNKL